MQLKSEVQWIRHPEGYWILRNPEFLTFLQVDELDKRIISQLGKKNIPQIIAEYKVTLEDIQDLLKLLAATGMLEGTQPPVQKFKLSQILYLKIPLFKPDKWLTKTVNYLGWIWTEQFAIILCGFLIQTLIVWFFHPADIVTIHHQIWQTALTGDWTPFFKLGGFTLFVILLHELGHAFTLKHYGGIVPDIGLLLICFFPGFYTNTTDQYSLIKRRKRVLVVAAGVIVQILIWAIAFWLFLFASPGSGLQENSYFLMIASLLTVIFNLNPMNKFDGYYLLVAGTGINNLRERSRKYYQHLFRRERSPESPANQMTLAFYTPLSIVYTFWIMIYFLSILGLWFSENSSLIFKFYQDSFFHLFN
jgi:Peptidase family M50.